MRRAAFAVAGLAATTTLLVVVKSGPAATEVAGELPAAMPEGLGAAPTGMGTPPPGTPGATASSSMAPPGDETDDDEMDSSGGSMPGEPDDDNDDDNDDGGGDGDGDSDDEKPGAAPKPTPRQTTKPPSNGTYTVAGPIVSNSYGNVQVRLTMSGDRITAIDTLEMPQSSSRSVQLSERVEQQMGAEALREQGAELDTVSGATYTSDSYQESLQAALDEARSR